MRNVLMFSLMCLALLAFQGLAKVETFNDFTTLTYSPDDKKMMEYTDVINLGYDTTEGGWVSFSNGGEEACYLDPDGGPDGSACITRKANNGFGRAVGYVAKVNGYVKGMQTLEFDLLYKDTGNADAPDFCVKVFGINPTNGDGSWIGLVDGGGGAGSRGVHYATKYADPAQTGHGDVASDGVMLLRVSNMTDNTPIDYTITTSPDWEHYSYDIDFGEGYEWIIIAFAHNFGNGYSTITEPTDYFGIDNVSFLTVNGIRGLAHSPAPVENDDEVDSMIVSSVSWYSPEQDKNGDPLDDPNIVSVDGYTVWFGTAEPNELSDTPTSTTSQSIPVTLDYETTYYWRVDTDVTWDSEEFVEQTDPNNPTTSGVSKGVLWKFTTLSEYRIPVLTIDNVITTLDLSPANLSATVSDNSEMITSVDFTLESSPVGSSPTLINTTGDNQNPTATLDADIEGTYIVKVAVSDGITPVEATAEVVFYADPCEAQKNAPSGWTADPYDVNGDCIVDLVDLADMATYWLNETSMTAQETY